MTTLAVDAAIAELVSAPVTVEMLRQDAAHFGGLATADAERLRAHLLASFESRGVPAGAVPVLAEELRTSVSPVVLAGAARAVRGLTGDAGRAVDWPALLSDAAERIADRDVFVRWQAGTVAPTWLRTARGELVAALDALPPAPGPLAGEVPSGPAIALDSALAGTIVVEDQGGTRLSLEPLLTAGPTLLAFFYTRCMNPQKCSLTITRLGVIARRAADTGAAMRILAVSYDPDFDAPHRLTKYGADRGFPFSDSARLVRSVEGWQSLRSVLRLQVGYGPTTVNEHAREVFRVTSDLVAHGLEADALADPTRLIG